MKKDIRYIPCEYCADTSDIHPHLIVNTKCGRCNDTKKIIDPKSILCNLCGESMCPDVTVHSGKWSSNDPHGLHEASVVGGYESYYLFDMTKYTFSFCEKCLRKLFIQCKIPPRLNDLNFGNNLQYIDGDERNWDNDIEAYEYRIWKDNGGYHDAYMNRKCNAKKDCPNIAAYTLLHDHTEFTEDALCEEHKDNKYLNSTLTKFIPNVLKPFL